MKTAEKGRARVEKVQRPLKRSKAETMKAVVKATFAAVGISALYIGVIAILMSPAFEVW